MAANKRGRLNMGDGDLPADEVLDFLRLIWAVYHGLQSTSKRMEAHLGVTGPQRFVIRMLGRTPGISPGKLAELLHVHPSTLTGVLRRLEQRGAITRVQDPSDLRRSILRLTAQGRALDEQREGTVESAIQRVIDEAKEADLDGARAVLGMLGRVLLDSMPSIPPPSSTAGEPTGDDSEPPPPGAM